MEVVEEAMGEAAMEEVAMGEEEEEVVEEVVVTEEGEWIWGRRILLP